MIGAQGRAANYRKSIETKFSEKPKFQRQLIKVPDTNSMQLALRLYFLREYIYLLKENKIKSKYLAKQIEVTTTVIFKFILVDSSNSDSQMHDCDFLEPDCHAKER